MEMMNSCRGEMRWYIKSTVFKGWTVVSMWELGSHEAD